MWSPDDLSSRTLDGTLSLDRVTFLLKTPQLSLWGDNDGEYIRNKETVEKFDGLVKKILRDQLDPDFLQGYPSELFAHHYRTSDGVDVQFGTKMPKRKKVTDEQLLAVFGTSADKENGFMYQYTANNYALRIEYNPNKCNLHSVFDLLVKFQCKITASSVRIARLDIAIDFPGDIIPYMCICHGMLKSFSASGTKGIESLYFGTRNSKNYFRLYNKRQEIIDNEKRDIGHSLWRLELESKDGFFLSDMPDYSKVFQRVKFYDGAITSGDWKFDALKRLAMYEGLQNVLRGLPPATAGRYRKRFRELTTEQNVENPLYIYNRDFPRQYMLLRAQILTALGYKMMPDDSLKPLAFDLTDALD